VPAKANHSRLMEAYSQTLVRLFDRRPTRMTELMNTRRDDITFACTALHRIAAHCVTGSLNINPTEVV